MTVELSGIDPGTPLVSGTAIEYTFGSQVVLRTEQGSEPPYWNVGYILNINAKIGNEDLDEDAVTGPFINRISKTVRWASTHFADDTVLPISISATFQLEKRDAQNNLIDFTVVTVGPYSVDVRTYNYSFSYGTRRQANADGELDPPNLARIKTSCLKVGELFDPFFAALPIDEGDILYQEDSFVGPTGRRIGLQLAQSNFFMPITHGSPEGLYDSWADEISWSRWASIVDLGRICPPLTVVVSYACNTLLGAGALGAPIAFGILTGTGSLIPNRAYVGYNSDVGWEAKRSTDNGATFEEPSNLFFQVSLFLKLIKDGLTLSEAVIEINNKIRLMDQNGQVQPMILVGDPFAKTFNVYLSSSETEALLEQGKEIKSWYWVH